MKRFLLAAMIAIVADTYATHSVAETMDRRVQLRNELAQLEQSGYDPAGNQIDYPANIQAAQEKIRARKQSEHPASEGPNPFASVSPGTAAN